MARLVAAALALALLSTAGGAAAKDSWGWGRADPWQGLDSNGHAQTCKHFANRARFRNRGLTPEHLARAADACVAALAIVDPAALQATGLLRFMPAPPRTPHGADPAARRAEAARLLVALTRLRLVVRDMNTTRLYGSPDPKPRAFPVADARGGWRAAGAPGRPVSAAGEYLIAREMGVLQAVRAFLSR